MIFGGTLTQVHEHGGIAAIIQDHVGAFAFGACCAEVKNAVGVVPVVSQGFALDGEHGRATGGDSRCGMVLSREDVATGPTHLGTQGLQGFDQHTCLNGHVQAAGDAGTLERLGLGEFFADGHQAGHFGFSNAQFFAAPGGQADVGNGAVGQEGRIDSGVHGLLQTS
jgi:hypothetical protein